MIVLLKIQKYHGLCQKKHDSCINQNYEKKHAIINM